MKIELPSTKTIEDVELLLKTDRNVGLGESEAYHRLATYGQNQIEQEAATPFIVFFLLQFKSVLMLIMIAAAIISGATGHFLDMSVIGVIVIINAIIGATHEYRAQNVIRSLHKAVPHKAKVLRNGLLQKIDASQLVPGDIVRIESGDIVPADGRLFDASELTVVESSLTGESLAVEKHTKTLKQEKSLGDQKNMLFMNTYIATGEGQFMVTATGMQTQMGNISKQIGLMKMEVPLFQKRVNELTKVMVISTLITTFLTFVIVFFVQDMPFGEAAYFMLATLVSGLPESLPMILTIVLSLAALRMARNKAVMKNLPAIESLSSVNTIITDKTGTLTENVMFVEKVILPDLQELNISGSKWEPKGEITKKGKNLSSEEKRELDFLGKLLAITNNATLEQKANVYSIVGDPTEAARLVLAEKLDWSRTKTMQYLKVLQEFPYDQETKIRGVFVAEKESKKEWDVIVGGAEQVLKRCKLTEEQLQKYNNSIEEYAKQAMRLQAIAYKPKGNGERTEDYILLGILCISDPIRADVANAIKAAKKAGIRVIMATGDHKETARAIAIRIGMLRENAREMAVLTESDLAPLTDAEFSRVVQNVSVFARVTPSTKHRIAEELQKQGNVIAMTGDGINDATALKKADIGIAMGTIGTDVAREAADVILVDDNFATIVSAITEGRTVFHNLRNTSLFLITTNLSEDFMILLAIFSGMPLPLLPLQILWLNLVTDGVSDVALATEKVHDDVLDEPPIPASEGIFTVKNFLFIISVAAIMAVISFWVFTSLLPYGIEIARTEVFLVLGLMQLWNMFNMRSLHHSIFQLGIFSNKAVIFAFIFSLLIAYLVVTIPPLAAIFSFAPITPVQFIINFCLAGLILVAGEVFKFFMRAKSFK
ncbi:MAG: cation-transporting P-type ATPase [Candidatus Dojkabacteria bacterium]|nr:MAG: cation-transporting P-type ATPase [Candidatus Dojkabacteria bacterium]